MRTNSVYILFLIVFLFLIPDQGLAQEIKTGEEVRIERERDSVFSVVDSLPTAGKIVVQDTVVSVQDTVRPPGLLTDVVKYQAEDYIRLSPRENRMYLYNQAQVIYGDMIITAGQIVIDNNKNEVYAYGIPDSTGAYSQKPIFTQGQNTVEPDSIRFNFKSQKALVYNSRTTEGAFKIQGEITKKENDSVYFMQNVKFTTSENAEDPDYYFYARRIKFVPKKKIVTGLVNMYIADVPTPLGLPFGYFPMTEEETSGFIIPSFGQSNDQGYFLQNGGYYFAISDYVDLMVLGDYYTNGSYGLRTETGYAKRYRYRGNLNFRYENNLTSERGFPDFSQRTNYNLQWSHSQDSKANPSSRFSASVNLGSSNYYRESVNQSNTANYLNNSMSSNVSYSKSFSGEPQINFSIAATHRQNINTQEIDMTLPTVQASMGRIFPLAPKLGAKKGLIQNINFQYNFRGENRIETTDEDFFTARMFEDADFGAQHDIPISTNFKILKHLSVSAGSNYRETWVFKTFERGLDPVSRRVVVTDTIRGFDSFRSYNFSTSVGTTIYGLVNFGKDKKYQAIRHVMRPSISYSLNPAFDQYYDDIEIINELDPTLNRIESFSRFQGGLYSPPGQNFSSALSLSINNTLEAKVRDKDSTATEPKKVILLNNFGISTAYNLAGDSLRFSPISVRGSIPIVPNKLDINVAANLDLYALDNNNRRIDKLNIENGGSLFRLTNANVSFGYSFSSKDFSGDPVDKDKLDNQTFRNGGRPDDLFGQGMDIDGRFDNEEEDPFENKEEAADTQWYNYKIPWDLRLAYTMTYSNTARQDEISSHSIMFSGNVEIAPKWRIGGSSGFDIKEGGFTYTQLRFHRDLDSWDMTFNWVPFSERTSWYFFIGIKSAILRDIKYDKRRVPDRRL